MIISGAIQKQMSITLKFLSEKNHNCNKHPREECSNGKDSQKGMVLKHHFSRKKKYDCEDEESETKTC
jgi:hypothetical protein